MQTDSKVDSLCALPRSIRIVFLIMAAILVLLQGCKKESDRFFKPDVRGRSGEVLVVINDVWKNDTVGHYLKHILGDVYLGLPTDEPIFEMHAVPHNNFDFQMHYFRNIILVNVADTVQTDTICYYKEMWAKQQAVITISAKRAENIPPMLKEHHIRIVSFFSKAERERLMTYYAHIADAGIISELISRWGISLTVPNSFERCVPENKNDMSWYMCNTQEFADGLVVYDYPYSGPRCMSKIYLLNKRDSLLRANIGGPQGSMMCTEARFGLDDIVYKFGQRMQSGCDVAELRGLWRLDDYPMGGPFIMRAVHDTVANRVVVTDGYVYYPSREQKRNHIRQIEAIMYSLKLFEKKTTTNGSTIQP